jgi:hypothetical protein
MAMPCFLCVGLWAQDAEVKAPKATKLKKALSTMARLPSLAFETSTTTTAQNAFVRGGRAPKPRTVFTNGVASGDILSVNLNDDEDQLVFHGRRMIAKNDDTDWVLRRGKLANGNKLPFVFDPQLFFSMLSQLPLKVMHKEVGTTNNKPVETYTISISGEASQNLLWGGVLPEPGAGGGAPGAMRVVMIGGAGGAFAAGPSKTKMTVDFAISIDPATSLVHAVKVRTYSKVDNPFGPRVVIGGRRFGGDEEEEEEEDEEEEKEFDPDNPQFKGGLPVRKRKGKTFMKFDLAFRQHNNAVLPALDARARSLLQLPR